MKCHQLIFLSLFSFLILSCSDWDDHFAANSSVTETQHSTLWQNIESNGNLTQFADLLRKTGFDQRLSASQTYTVWAPEDNTFDYQTVSGYGYDRILKEFVENHIAHNNYPASGVMDKNIYMLNEKKLLFSGEGTYTIQSIPLKSLNISSSNGTLHTIGGRTTFLSSIYESLDNLEYPLDSIRSYIHSFDEKSINENRSKPGPVVNGEQTYLDTIYYEYNYLLNNHHAYINREDSSYTMLMPTNKAWTDAVAKAREYCNYLPSFVYMDNIEEEIMEKVSLKDAAGLRDSIAKTSVIASLFYNNNLYDNKRLKTLEQGTTLQCDSLTTTRNYKLYGDDAASVFVNAKRVDMSNGAVWITDSLRIPSWTVWNPELRFEAENFSLWGAYTFVNGSPSVKEVAQQNEEVYGRVSNNYYIELEPQSRAVNPDIYFYLPEVRSTTYNIYVVMVPANINSKYYSGELKPNLMDFMIGYADENGLLSKASFEIVRANVDSLHSDNGYTSKVDTIFVGEFNFPVSYFGMASGSKRYAPYLRIRSRVTNKESAGYDRNLRIDCIILRPKELDSYITDHPNYKYQ